MYQSSPSSSSHNSVGPSELTRYGSAPSSFLTTAVDSVVGSSHRNPNLVGRYFSADSSCLTSESTCKFSSLNDPQNSEAAPSGSYGAGSSSLVRQRSSPAGFVSQVAAENGFSITRGTPDYSSKGDGLGISRLKSQLSFTGQDSLTQVSHVSENLDGVSSSSSHQNAAHSFAAAAGFSMESWDNTNSISFSAPQSKHAKYIDGDIFNSINSLETQFSMPQTTLEMATMDKLMNIPEDSVPCKIRAKRGCATHPRSIAERERRIRISGKLKKLQELVPNMDKQTSYADMLDLAVKHIKGLQNEVKKLHNELQNCTCGCKPSS